MNENWLVTTYDEQERIIHQFIITDCSKEIASREASQDPRVSGEEDPRVENWSIKTIQHPKRDL